MMARLSGVARGPRPGNVKPYCIQEPPYHVQHGAPLSSTISHVVRTHVPDQRGVSPCIVCEPAVCAARRGVSSGSGGSPRSPLGKPGVPAAAVRDLCGAAPWERGNLGRFRSRRDAGALRKKPQEVLCDVCLFKMRRLLLDSRVVHSPMAYPPFFVLLSFLKALFFKSLQNALRFSDTRGA